MRVTEYGLEWEISDDQKKGQLGLLREDHYRPLFTTTYQPPSFSPTDVWLDIGANIGAFAVRAASLVKEVIAVEPEPECYEQLKRNIQLNGVAEKVVTLKAAVVAGPDQWVSLAISNSYSSTHRIGKIRGRKTIEVAGRNINEIVQSHKVNKIKMDCESCEAELLAFLDYGPIEEIVFEWHFAMIKDHPWSQYFKILDLLEYRGFTILRGPREQSKTWHAIVWAKRL